MCAREFSLLFLLLLFFSRRKVSRRGNARCVITSSRGERCVFPLAGAIKCRFPVIGFVGLAEVLVNIVTASMCC